MFKGFMLLTKEATSALIYRQFNIQSDLAALVRLFQAVEQADQTGEQVTEDALREQLTWSGQDPALNNWIVTDSDSSTLVGYGSLQKTPHDPNADLYITVHPARRRQGIGSHLFTYLFAPATELNAQALRVYVPVQNKGADLFIRTHGFEPVSAFTRLSLHVTEAQSFAPPLLPHGFTTRSYDQIEQISLYTEALNRGYEGYWGHLQCTQEDVALLLQQFNHAGIFLLFAPDGTIAGTCRAELSEQLTQERKILTGLIDAPGIVAQYRAANLALPLLLTAIYWLLPQQPAILVIEAWGETPDILTQYRALGFTITKEEISYRRDML